MKKCSVNGQIMDVITEEEFRKNPQIYINNNTAVINGNTVYPIRSGIKLNSPGVYNRGFMYRYVEPQIQEDYSASKVIDFDNARNMSELIEKNNVYQDMEREILTSPDNLYQPKARPDDSVEVIAMKESICDKNFDINKYKDRFGDSFNNDKRALDLPRMSLPKMVRMCNNLDIKLEIILSNASDDVANPMSKEIRYELTKSNIDEEE